MRRGRDRDRGCRNKEQAQARARARAQARTRQAECKWARDVRVRGHEAEACCQVLVVGGGGVGTEVGEPRAWSRGGRWAGCLETHRLSDGDDRARPFFLCVSAEAAVDVDGVSSIPLSDWSSSSSSSTTTTTTTGNGSDTKIQWYCTCGAAWMQSCSSWA